MKLSKSTLKRIIQEELVQEIESRLPRARDFGSTSPEMHARMDTQKERIEDYMASSRALQEKIAQYVKDYENVGPDGRSDLGGLTPKWRNLRDALNAIE